MVFTWNFMKSFNFSYWRKDKLLKTSGNISWKLETFYDDLSWKLRNFSWKLQNFHGNMKVIMNTFITFHNLMVIYKSMKFPRNFHEISFKFCYLYNPISASTFSCYRRQKKENKKWFHPKYSSLPYNTIFQTWNFKCYLPLGIHFCYCSLACSCICLTRSFWMSLLSQHYVVL